MFQIKLIKSFINVFKIFSPNRPKPAYGRQGLDWIECDVTHGGPQLTSFD